MGESSIGTIITVAVVIVIAFFLYKMFKGGLPGLLGSLGKDVGGLVGGSLKGVVSGLSGMSQSLNQAIFGSALPQDPSKIQSVLMSTGIAGGALSMAIEPLRHGAAGRELAKVGSWIGL